MKEMHMAKFRKKPVAIEAVQFDGSPQTAQAVTEFAGKWAQPHADGSLTIHTLEGPLSASVGDWIIRGVKGEFYPCKPDIFAATYEPVEPPRAEVEANRAHMMPGTPFLGSPLLKP
jgi:hypothetical protein